MTMDIKQEIEQLRKELKYHNDRYHNLDDPEISDYDYDQLSLRLRKLEQENPQFMDMDSPTQKVGAAVKREGGILVKHNVPILSLHDVFNKDELYSYV